MITIQCDEHIKKAVSEGLKAKGITASIGDVIRSVVKLADTISDKDFENSIFYIP